MGEVWEGVDLRLRRPVAVKILPLSGAADETDVARFRREAEISAVLNHPGITTVFDVDEHTDGGVHLLFLVMELMRGCDLAAVLRAAPGGRPVAEVTGWAVQILDALAAAHKQGVVHRDIKPANLFLTDDGRVKVCDFGISRIADATKITATGSSTGTPLYMAPEQIEGNVVDERADLYAFGCVLYQLLTGTTWVDSSASVGTVLHQHLNRPPASPQSVRPDVGDELARLVLELLAKRPEDRPADATTVAERLRGGTAERPEFTRPTLRQPTAERPAAVDDADGRTANAAMVLALLCLPGLLALIIQAAGALTEPDAPAGLIAANLVVAVAETAALITGTVLLSRRQTAGRRIIAAAGVVTTLQGLTASVQYVLTAGTPQLDSPTTFLVFAFYPLMAVLAATAVITAVHPSTERWCLNQR